MSGLPRGMSHLSPTRAPAGLIREGYASNRWGTAEDEPSSAPVIPPVRWAGVDVISAVQAWWQGMPAMQALTADGKLWHRVAPEDTPLPYATVFLVSETPEIWTTSYPFERSSVQINCHAATDSAARGLGLAIRAAIRGAPLVVGVQDVCHVLPDGCSIDIGEELGPGGRDCWVATEVFDIPWTT